MIESFGKIIPESSWVNIRVTLNVIIMFTETEVEHIFKWVLNAKIPYPKLYDGDKDNQNY